MLCTLKENKQKIYFWWKYVKYWIFYISKFSQPFYVHLCHKIQIKFKFLHSVTWKVQISGLSQDKLISAFIWDYVWNSTFLSNRLYIFFYYYYFFWCMPCSNLAWRTAVHFTYLHVVTWGQPDPSQTSQWSWCSQCILEHQTCKVRLSPTALGNNTFTHLEVSFFFYSFNLVHNAKLNSFSKN